MSNKYSFNRPTDCLSSEISFKTILPHNQSNSTTVQASRLVKASLASKSWEKYKSALNCLKIYSKDEGLGLTWPLSQESIRGFTVWALTKRNLAPATVATYLSGIRFCHLLKGIQSPACLDDKWINILIRGARNLRSLAPQTAKPTNRRAATLSILKLIKYKTRSNLTTEEKSALWCICTMAFFGSARMGELLSESKQQFDFSATLQWKDVKDNKDGLLILLKNPKTGTNAQFIDIFPFPYGGLCPVEAFENWKKDAERANLTNPNLPVFRFTSGHNISIKCLNSVLKSLLQENIDWNKHTISAHSFRAGLPSELEQFPDLLNDKEVRGWGRWASDCHLDYARLKQIQKEQIFSKISSALRSKL